MFLARVKGHVVATAKDPAIKGHKLSIVEPLKVDYDDPATAGGDGDETDETGRGGRFEVTGRAIVAIDTVGAGEGQLVLVVQGSSARMAENMNKIPVDAVVLGIVDEAVVMGARVDC
ncbi:MAG: EutN/CcmL family microcompartment protein [Phycisphaeraceae bacterium]|jgi:ethanolamine utilization protein EutN|nr:EutN/CcmL family microcompartment protein [Phycisphaeraceae bacterium]MDP7348415.1 EutN/CcmL family microcompartment protein [Phycisphaeraceae bacterium]